MMKKIMWILLAATMALGMPMTAAAAGSGVFAGYHVTVVDSATPAAGMRGRLNDATTMLFVATDGRELGSISYSDYNAVSAKYGRVVPLEGGGSLRVPPDDTKTWEQWYAGEFNAYRGLERSAVQTAAASPEADTPTTNRKNAQQFYKEYDLRVYDREKPAVLFGSYIVVGNYECQVFYAGDGAIIGIIYGDWPRVDAQEQIDYFNAYRGLPSAKLSFPQTKSMEESGIPIYSEGLDAGMLSPFEKDRELQDCLSGTNRRRAEAGVQELAPDDYLMAFAAIRARELQELFSHTRLDGTQAVSAKGVSAENISIATVAAGSGAKRVERWYNSDGHRKNMLNGKYTRIGIGCHLDADGQVYWVQVFA